MGMTATAEKAITPRWPYEDQGNHGSGILIGDGNTLLQVAEAADMGLPAASAMEICA